MLKDKITVTAQKYLSKNIPQTLTTKGFKRNNREIVTLKSISEIESQKAELAEIIKDWIKASSN